MDLVGAIGIIRLPRAPSPRTGLFGARPTSSMTARDGSPGLDPQRTTRAETGAARGNDCSHLILQWASELPASRLMVVVSYGYRCGPAYYADPQNVTMVSANTWAQRRTLSSSTYSSLLWAPAPPGPKITVGMPARPKIAESIHGHEPIIDGV